MSLGVTRWRHKTQGEYLDAVLRKIFGHSVVAVLNIGDGCAGCGCRTKSANLRDFGQVVVRFAAYLSASDFRVVCV